MKKTYPKDRLDKRSTKNIRLKGPVSIAISARVKKDIADRIDAVAKLLVPTMTRSEVISSIIEEWASKRSAPTDAETIHGVHKCNEFTKSLLNSLSNIQASRSLLSDALGQWVALSKEFIDDPIGLEVTLRRASHHGDSIKNMADRMISELRKTT